MSSRGRVRRSVDTAPAADTPERDDALGDSPAPTQETSVEQVPVGDIDDPEWRAPVDTADPAYRALKASVRASGILQPLLVRRTAQGGLQVVSGMRRLRAAREMGQEAVPATVQELTEVQAIVGAWDALVRERATVDGRDAIERRLLDGGCRRGMSPGCWRR
jgi:ParB-like chromosome segregation protein Spo0J